MVPWSPSVRSRTETVGDGDYLGLDRSQPERQGAGVVLDEDAQEALDGAKDGAVEHPGALDGVVCRAIGEIKTLRQIEVHLDGGALPPSPSLMS